MTLKLWLSSSELFSLWLVSSLLCASVSYLQCRMCHPCLLGLAWGFCEMADVGNRASDTRNVTAWVRCSAARGDVLYQYLLGPEPVVCAPRTPGLGLCVLFCDGPPLPLIGQTPPQPPPHQPPVMATSVRVFVSTTLFSLWILFTLLDVKDPGKSPLPPPTQSTDPVAAEGRPFLQASFVWSFSFSRENSNSEESGLWLQPASAQTV